MRGFTGGLLPYFVIWFGLALVFGLGGMSPNILAQIEYTLVGGTLMVCGSLFAVKNQIVEALRNTARP